MKGTGALITSGSIVALIVAIVLKQEDEYKYGQLPWMDSSIVSIVDVTFTLALVGIALGIVFLLIGYLRPNSANPGSTNQSATTPQPQNGVLPASTAPSTKYCAKCGASCASTDSFCKACGSPLSTSNRQ